ncbi:N-acetylmuramoyl-L-alanine amidase [uncultured Alistipes sp.]|uniref:N-acetylmuramoyl-L-alanine amidase n=1 Tax=uncultured Alistipes sp. TaxID=538949 RepID=UPI0026268A61|nr:N-acetylmuramoyl-L-alanine amidase [uncultured Alistipes sp.]
MALRILLDNGHGRETPGKRSPVWADGAQLLEWEFNRDIVRRIARQLAHRGISFDILVPEHDDAPLAQRARRANHICETRGAANCLLVSVHANAGGGTGWEVYTSPGRTAADDYADIFFKHAALAFPEFRMRTDTSDGDNDKEAGIAILRQTRCPALLTENFFMDNERDCRLLLSEEGRRRIAQMHVDAILECVEFHEKQTR